MVSVLTASDLVMFRSLCTYFHDSIVPIFYAVLPEGAEITGTDFCSSPLHTAFTLLAYMCFLRYRVSLLIVLSCCTALWWKLELLFIIYAAFLENIYFAPVHVLNAHHPVQNFHKIFTSKHHNVPHVGHITLQSVWLRTFPLMAESFFYTEMYKKRKNKMNQKTSRLILIGPSRCTSAVYPLHVFSKWSLTLEKQGSHTVQLSDFSSIFTEVLEIME